MKLCTVCGVVTSRAGSRCTDHARQSNRSRHNAVYSTRAWQRLSARVLRAWRGERGNWCPGYQRDAHAAADLTVDHVIPLAAGGAPFDVGNTAVLCRSCNSTKGASEPDRGSPHAGSALPDDREAEGPIFPKAIADLIGSSREAAQRLVEKLVAGGSVARARGGYVVARVRIAEEAEEAQTLETWVSTSSAHSPLARGRACVTTASTSSASSREIREEEEEAETHIRAREAAPVLRVVPADPTRWANPCHWYREHQSKHRQTPSGWTCDACHPEEGPTA